MEIERASFGKDAWTAELFREYWRACPELFLIAKDRRRIAGYRIGRVDWRGAELESIAVDPSYRGRGIAQALLNATISQLRAGSLRLMVSTSNAAALRFYQQFGFSQVRKVPGYYGVGRDAWRMRLKISGPNQQANK